MAARTHGASNGSRASLAAHPARRRWAARRGGNHSWCRRRWPDLRTPADRGPLQRHRLAERRAWIVGPDAPFRPTESVAGGSQRGHAGLLYGARHSVSARTEFHGQRPVDGRSAQRVYGSDGRGGDRQQHVRVSISVTTLSDARSCSTTTRPSMVAHDRAWSDVAATPFISWPHQAVFVPTPNIPTSSCRR